MSAAHEHYRFQQAVVYTVAITYTVEGGRRFGTADRRAGRVAELLANTATRMAGWLRSKRGWRRMSCGGQELLRRVRFSAANTGAAVDGEPDERDRYLHPDHREALRLARGRERRLPRAATPGR